MQTTDAELLQIKKINLISCTMAQHNELGKWGEEHTAEYLVKNDYSIVERDWRLGKRDVDIIALSPDGRFIVFVEVKTRAQDDVMDPVEAVNVQKMKSIGYCANVYIKMNNIELEPRFDIVSIVKEEEIKMVHIEDAFNPCLL